MDYCISHCELLVRFFYEIAVIFSREIPDGFKISELNQTHVESIRNSWEYTQDYEQLADLRYWIKYNISNFHTVCIETEEGHLVAWEYQQEYGGMSMLYVESEYRRASLGSIVTRSLARKLVEDGQLVFVFVDENNSTSINFHEKNGFTLMPIKFSFAFYNS
jgi:ribosomal protein S18 acetylase RimI-like enzyme